MKVKAHPFSSSDWDIFFPVLGPKSRPQQVPSSPWKFGRLASSLTLLPHSLGVYDSVHMACVKASLRSPYAFGSQHGGWLIQEDTGVSQMGPDLAMQLPALQLRMAGGDESGCWEEGSLTLNLVMVFFIQIKDWTNTHTHAACIHMLFKSIAYTQTHHSPITECYFGFPGGLPLNMCGYKKPSPMLALFTCHSHSLFLCSPTYFLTQFEGPLRSIKGS